MNYKLFAALFAAAVVFPALASAGTILAFQSGATDPTSGGWTKTAPACTGPGGCSPNPTSGAVPNDLGTTPAWNVTDPSTEQGGLLNYYKHMNPSDLALAAVNGWVLDVNVRVTDGPSTAPNPAVFVSFETATARYALFFGTNPIGAASVAVSVGQDPNTGNLISGATYDTNGPGYHDYSLVYDPTLGGQVELFVDGVKRIGNYFGDTYVPLSRIVWGSDSSDFTGSANFASVSFTVNDSPSAPEPDTLLMLATGMLGLAVQQLLVRRRSAS